MEKQSRKFSKKKIYIYIYEYIHIYIYVYVFFPFKSVLKSVKYLTCNGFLPDAFLESRITSEREISSDAG